MNYFKTLNRKSEAALESKKVELERINRYQSQFFVNISHEIRTPLTLIKGQVEELKEMSKSKPILTEIEQKLNRQVNQIKTMVDDVLDSAKMKSSDFELIKREINITKLAHEIFLSFETNFKLKDIDLRFNTPEKSYLIQGDRNYLKRALSNLVLNALKYTDKGGEVIIKIREFNNEFIIEVKDNGIGISKSDLNKICNQFYQVNNDINRSGGSGIGLSFTKEIVELHEGTLKISSKLNHGSIFEIVFPFDKCIEVTREMHKPLIRKSAEKSGTLKTKKEKCFLIVDDNREMREYLISILNRYHCLEAENGLEALKLLEQHKVDFIITDYMMPEMDGLNFVKALKERKSQIPILMLTARTDKKSRLDSFRFGIDDYLNKPFDRDELLIRIENTLHNHLNRIDYNQEENITAEEVEKNQTWIDEVEYFIFQECSDINFKQVDIAEHFHISESSLYRKIKSSRGVTPNQFITELKLQKARKIIEAEPEVSLKRLSLEVGFKHNHYFSEMYFKRFGNKPWN